MDIGLILSQLAEWVINLVSSLGYWGVFIGMAVESASVPIPSEVIMGLAGFLVYQGKLAFIPAAFAGALGNTIGSLFTYAYGYYGGRPIIRRWGKFLGVTEEKFLQVETWFNKWGDKIILFSQMIPLVRSVISLPAGIMKVNIIKFEIYTFIGAFIWCLFLVGAAALLGEQWEKLSGYLDQFQNFFLIGAGLALTLFVIYKVFKRKQKMIKEEI